MIRLKPLRARALCFALIVFCAHIANASIISYTYDPAGRLITADYGANRTTSYAYDNAGNLLQTATPTPGLTMKLSGNLLILSWPISPAGFGLFSSSSLGAGAPWSSVGGTLVPVGNLNMMTVPTSGGPMFYRLQK